MTVSSDIVFYAPMKPPDHPTPSGDRTMARLLMKALDKAGFSPEVITRFRSFEKAGDPGAQDAIRQEAEQEAQRIITDLRQRPALPQLWFSYHVYYKSPDWIGPLVAAELGIPYVVAEGSRAMKRANGPWAIGHDGAEKALNAAKIIFAMTAVDEEALREHATAGQDIVSLPPFIDLAEWPASDAGRASLSDGPAWLLTVAMVREGDKLQSYRQLAEAFGKLKQPATLDIIGDGDAMHALRNGFEASGGAFTLHGEVTDKPMLASFFNRAHLYVWPAVNEAYGMAFLEAQAFGCPVIAGNHGGVASVVRNGETGILVQKNDMNAFAAAIDALLADPEKLARMSNTARRFVREERSLDSAARILRQSLQPLIKGSGA